MMLDRIFLDTHPPLGPNDLETRTDVSDVGNLDFSESVVDLLTKRGAAAARPVLTNSCLPRRGRVVTPMPPVATSLVTADAAPGSREVIRSSVKTTAHYRGPNTRQSLDTVQARVARAGTLGVLRSLWLNPEHAAGDSVAFDPTIQWAAKRVLGIGAVSMFLGYGDRGIILSAIILILTLLSLITIVQRMLWVYKQTEGAKSP
jgi:hypothetical protein